MKNSQLPEVLGVKAIQLLNNQSKFHMHQLFLLRAIAKRLGINTYKIGKEADLKWEEQAKGLSESTDLLLEMILKELSDSVEDAKQAQTSPEPDHPAKRGRKPKNS